MPNKRKLQIEQLDKKLEAFKEASRVKTPETGWINNIRLVLNITLEQLGDKLCITKQGVKKIEEREASGSISINSLKEVGQAVDMKLVYGFVPIHGSIENLVDHKANELARKIVLRTNQNMKLENQENSEERIKKAIEELKVEIKNEMWKTLWD